MLAAQRGPELDAVVDKTLAVQAIGPAFGMHNAAPGRHPVDRARLDALHASEAVAVHDGAFKQIGHGRQTDMRLRTTIVAGRRPDPHRAKMIKKDKGPDRLAPGMREQPSDQKTVTQVFVLTLQFHLPAHGKPSFKVKPLRCLCER